MTRSSTVSKQSHDGDGGKTEKLMPPVVEKVLQKDEISSQQNVPEVSTTTKKKAEDGVACMKLR